MDWKTKGINWITETEENLSELQFPGMEREEEQEADRLNQMVKERKQKWKGTDLPEFLQFLSRPPC